MKLLSSLIKGNHLTISEPKMIVVERPVTIETDTENQGQFLEDLTTMNLSMPVYTDEVNLQARHTELKEELVVLQMEITQQLEDAKQEAMRIQQKTEEECQQLRADAIQEIEMLKAQTMEECIAIQAETYEKAYQSGLKQAHEDIESDRQLAFVQIKEMLEEAQGKCEAIISEAEPAIVELSMTVAKKIIAAELNSRPELIIDIVKEAIDNLDNPQNVRAQVNPKDELYLSGQGKYITSSQYGNVHLNVVPDDSIERGGCVVESNMAVVDSRLETRINNVQNILNEVLINEGTV